MHYRSLRYILCSSGNLPLEKINFPGHKEKNGLDNRPLETRHVKGPPCFVTQYNKTEKETKYILVFC